MMNSLTHAASLSSEKDNLDYWNQFYRKVNIHEESTFCGFVKGQIDSDSIILDIGCGSGRDTFSFARDGFRVLGIDRSEEAIRINLSSINGLELSDSRIDFCTVDISDVESLEGIIKSVSTSAGMNKVVVYLRFVLHSINDETQRVLLTTLSEHLRSGDIVAAEFRTLEDRNRGKIYDNHYRRFVDADGLMDVLNQEYDFSEKIYLKGTGMSLYNDEDPYLARFIVEKR